MAGFFLLPTVAENAVAGRPLRVYAVRMLSLDTPVASLGVTAKRRADILADMGLHTVRDLLFHFPLRHEEFLSSVEIESVQPDTSISITARIVKSSNKRLFRRRMTMTEAVLDDGTGTLTALWFNQPYLVKNLAAGRVFRFTGKVTKNKFGLRLMNPMYEAMDRGAVSTETIVAQATASDDALLPVYPLTVGMSQNALRKIVSLALPATTQVEDPLPDDIRKEHKLLALADAMRGIHAPTDAASLRAARHRLAFDEVLRLQLALGRMRRLREARPAPTVPYGTTEQRAIKSFVASLPFTLTADQKVAAERTLRDMVKGHQMHRLLDGDVGSGKTVVAAIAMMNSARAGFQSAMMAPTEILASQHYATLSRLFAKQPFSVALWTNAYKRVMRGGKEIVCANKKEALALGDDIASGGVQIVIGTHALVETAMRFSALALAVVDEQHRFGVRIRSMLTEKSGMPGLEPHLLSMTATPIPRSLALAMFGDLDLSVLKEKPKGRQVISTCVVLKKDRSAAYDKVCEEIAAGRQAFIVCPLIDPSDVLGVASVTDEYEKLRKKELLGISVGMLHGKMTAPEKERAMADFLEKKTMALVSTSVVEVGVDIPNASVMCIEGAERFGLAQLHQFRGRVGRGAHQSYCYLLPTSASPGVKARLNAVVKHDDGFSLAEKDLELRGPGDVLGTAQSGYPEFRMASFADAALIADAKEAAEAILAEDPMLEAHQGLRRDLKQAAEEAHLE